MLKDENFCRQILEVFQTISTSKVLKTRYFNFFQHTFNTNINNYVHISTSLALNKHSFHKYLNVLSTFFQRSFNMNFNIFQKLFQNLERSFNMIFNFFERYFNMNFNVFQKLFQKLFQRIST